MEFYSKLRIQRNGSRTFQFPTGWNSTVVALRAVFIRSGFNSQRDGILLEGVHFYYKDMLFQFPTGWNSTNPNGIKTYLIEVSIPNGMEFYDGEPSHQRKNRSFNSQRDGILPVFASYEYSKRKFQFPTGWNSTSDQKHHTPKPEVSIPNGMEFYKPKQG